MFPSFSVEESFKETKHFNNVMFGDKILKSNSSNSHEH